MIDVLAALTIGVNALTLGAVVWSSFDRRRPLTADQERRIRAIWREEEIAVSKERQAASEADRQRWRRKKFGEPHVG